MPPDRGIGMNGYGSIAALEADIDRLTSTTRLTLLSPTAVAGRHRD